MVRIVRTGLALMLAVVIGSCAGCGSKDVPSATDSEGAFHHNALLETGQIYTGYLTNTGKVPQRTADIAKYETGWPTAFSEIKAGNILVLWGAPVAADASGTVLAYEKSVPEAGGYVLMQDGITVKKLTADQFKTAPKAAGNVEVSAKKSP